MHGVIFASLLGCHGGSDDPDPTGSDDTGDDSGTPDDTSTLPGVDIDWGIVDACGVAANGGFDDFYTDGSAVLVYGDDTREAALATEIVGWYAGGVTLEPRAYTELTDDEKQRDLLVIGSPESNPLLEELNGSSPVWFEDGDFIFGGHRYDEHGNGIAFIEPSPFAAGKWITVYAGNSFEGLYSTFTVYTGGFDYETTRGRGVLMQEGSFCRDGETWGWYDGTGFVRYDDWPVWQEWVDGLEETATEHHLFRYLPGSYAAGQIATRSALQEEWYGHALDVLAVEPLDEPIATYLYPDNDTKGELTGISGNGHANDLNYENHMVFNEKVDAFTIHEDVHVVAWYRIGQAQTALLGEGLAVAVEGTWWGEPLEDWASQFELDGSLPSLADLEDDWSSIGDATSYPVSGQFVQWLIATWGIEAVKALYVAPDLDVAFESELGMTHDEVEAAWIAAIP